MFFCHVVKVTEYDSWSGPKVLDYEYYWKKEDAIKSVEKNAKTRTEKVTPGYYIRKDYEGQKSFPHEKDVK